MKVFFGSFTDPSVEIDAHVKTASEAVILLDVLRRAYRSDSIVLRLRRKECGTNSEWRYIGLGSKAGPFIQQLKQELIPDG